MRPRDTEFARMKLNSSQTGLGVMGMTRSHIQLGRVEAAMGLSCVLASGRDVKCRVIVLLCVKLRSTSCKSYK